jgi:hypothetical protein
MFEDFEEWRKKDEGLLGFKGFIDARFGVMGATEAMTQVAWEMYKLREMFRLIQLQDVATIPPKAHKGNYQTKC